MPIDANVDGIHTSICLERDCELAEECKDAINGVFPLPGSTTMNKGQQQEKVCKMKTARRVVQRGMSPRVRASFHF
jgi:hypothetical protein